VKSEKLEELNNGWSLVFTKPGWFTGAAYVSSKTRRKSCGLKMILSQRKRPVVRKPLAASLPVAARCMHCRIVLRFGRWWRLALGFNGDIFQFLGSRMFSGTPWTFYKKGCIL
jgi:hypothetical protein